MPQTYIRAVWSVPIGRISPDAVVAATGYVRALEGLVGHLGVLDDEGRPVAHGPRTPKDAPGLFFKAIIVVFDLFALLIVYDSVRQIVQWLRHVRASMRWTTLPAFLGGQLQGTLLLQPGLRVNGPIRATLRCVQDEEGPPDPESGISQVEPFVVYEQTRMIPPGDEKLRELPLSFDIPRDLPDTRLQKREAVYWQVAIEVPLLGPDFETVFLAPVYASRD